MTEGDWPVTVDGRAFEPLPDSWVEAGHDDGAGHPRLYAVSGAVSGRQVLHVRYVHPRTEYVLTAEMRGTDGPEGGTVPEMLDARGTWPRSITPRGVDPQGVARDCEVAHLRKLWHDRVDEIPSAGTEHCPRGAVADGGHRQTIASGSGGDQP